jgi:hypothetical protein
MQWWQINVEAVYLFIYNLHDIVSGYDRLVIIGSRISIQGTGMHVKEV